MVQQWNALLGSGLIFWPSVNWKGETFVIFAPCIVLFLFWINTYLNKCLLTPTIALASHNETDWFEYGYAMHFVLQIISMLLYQSKDFINMLTSHMSTNLITEIEASIHSLELTAEFKI